VRCATPCAPTSRAELLGLLKFGAQLHSEQIERLSITPQMLIALKPPATFAADPAALKQLVTQLLHKPTVPHTTETP
jgi:hypothetical protein